MNINAAAESLGRSKIFKSQKPDFESNAISGTRPWKLSNMDLDSYRPKPNMRESNLSVKNALKIETNESIISGSIPFVSATTKVN